MAGVRRYLFWISYDGSRFPEMAKGGTGFGVMDFFGQVLRNSFVGIGERLKTSAASRTDRGVHAIRNAIVVQVPLEYGHIDERKSNLLYELNTTIDRCCPNSLKILDFHSVSLGFSARHHISYRRYKYRICVTHHSDAWSRFNKQPSLMHFAERNYSWILPPGFDIYRAREACCSFEGTHNMASFLKHPEREKRHEKEFPSTIKSILHCDLNGGEPRSFYDSEFDFFDISVVSRSFLREQVRRMIGVIIGQAYGLYGEHMIEWLLKNPDPKNFYARRLRIAPPQGLFLEDLVYDDRMFSNPIPYHTHGWDAESDSPDQTS